jgi:hypothetical protein
MARKTLLDILISENTISAKDAQRISEQARGDNKRMEELLIAAHISEEDILSAKSALFGVPSFRLHDAKIPFDVLKNISEESARHYQIAPLQITDGVLSVGMVEPDNIEAREALKFISANVDMHFKIFVIDRSDFNHILQQYKGLGGEVESALGECSGSFC